MANLASTYRNQGRWDEAEELGVQVMETRKRGAWRGASKYADQHEPSCVHGQDADAISLMQKCVQLQMRILGFHHPDSLSSSAMILKACEIKSL